MGLHGSEFVVSEISRVRLKLSFDLWVVIRQLPLCGTAVSSFDGTRGWVLVYWRETYCLVNGLTVNCD